MSGETKGSFDALLEEISTDLNKAMPPADGDTAKDDKNIKAAAEEGEDEEEGDKPKEDDEAQGEMKKSFTIKLEDGTEIEAVDGADLIKSLVGRVEKNEAGVGTLLGEFKKLVLAQGELIKSLQGDVVKLGNSGAGRKAVLTIAEKPAPAAEDLAKSEAGQMGAEEFMAKALIAQTAGRITGTDVAIAESHLNAGKAPPKSIIAAVMDGGK